MAKFVIYESYFMARNNPQTLVWMVWLCGLGVWSPSFSERSLTFLLHQLEKKRILLLSMWMILLFWEMMSRGLIIFSYIYSRSFKTKVARSKKGIWLSQWKHVMHMLSVAGMLGCKPTDIPTDPNFSLLLDQGYFWRIKEDIED